MPMCGGVEYVFFLVVLVAAGWLFLRCVRLAGRAWRTESFMRGEVRSMSRCDVCGKDYDELDVQNMLDCMGFGPGKDPVDEDYLVVIDGLCPDCWPEYDQP